MTIQEAIAAARNNAPVVYEDVLLGPMLFGRIGSIRKDFAALADTAKGREPESYSLELLPMTAARSVMVVRPEAVRIAEAEDLREIGHYVGEDMKPPVHKDLLCPELRANRESE